MADTLGGFPFWVVRFDETGALTSPDRQALLQEFASRALTDLFIFSHGWNNDEATAMTLYNGFYGEMSSLLKNGDITNAPNTSIGFAGVIWPSILFPGDTATPTSGGAASFDGTQNKNSLESELPKVFSKLEQGPDLQRLISLLNHSAPENDSLLEFRDVLSSLLRKDIADDSGGLDNLELQAATVTDDDDWLRILDAFSVQPSGGGPDGGGAADLSSFFGRLWNGAQNVLRVATYWQMKNRAGVVGSKGLGPLVGQIQEKIPKIRVHLLGHSFGARLISYSLTGLPASALPSPVKSLFLIQGAFSHFAFANSLPFDSTRKGDLAGMAVRVDGPLLTTHSLFDLAVGQAYPAASILAGQDAADATDLLYRWEGMGHDGAQAVGAQSDMLGAVKTPYPFQVGSWTNLDGNQIIKNGAPPSGAHSDIIHPEIAWAALRASRVVAS